MATNSSQAGYLQATTEPLYGDPADDLMQAVIVGITGLPGDLVRPRWQPEPPQLPDFGANWVAVGIDHIERDVFAYRDVLPTGLGSKVERDEILSFLVSAYGPAADRIITALCDGMEIGQNRAALQAAHMDFIDASDARVLPALLKEKWVRRVDATLRIRRRARRDYAVLSVESAQVDLNNEHYHEIINATNT